MTHPVNGPWNYQEGADAYTHIVRDATGGIVAQLRQDPGGTAEAQARLCAAAPDLLAALKANRDLILGHLNDVIEGRREFDAEKVAKVGEMTHAAFYKVEAGYIKLYRLADGVWADKWVYGEPPSNGFGKLLWASTQAGKREEVRIFCEFNASTEPGGQEYIAELMKQVRNGSKYNG